MIEHELSPITTKDGLKLYTTTNAVENPIAGLLIIHGLGEHIERYDSVFAALAKNQIIAYGIDLRGHGKSEGKKGHSPSYELLMEDIEELMKTFRADFNELPMFIFGHSMGGNLVANFVIRRRTQELNGFIVSSPFFELAFKPPKWKESLGKMMSKTFPSYTDKSDLNTKGLSKIPEVVTAYENDPLVHAKITAGLYTQLTSSGVYALKNSEKIEIPGFAYHGDTDPITSHDATKSFAENNELIFWKSYQGVLHEGHNDKEQEEVIDALIAWIHNNI
jgi:alpha-beta hydrolase superfamily lysophospholipase